MTDNILFLSDTSDGQNWGCYATSSVLRDLLQRSATIEKTIFLEDLYYQEMNLRVPSIPDLKYVLKEWAKVPTGKGSLLGRVYRNGTQPVISLLDYLPMTAEQFSIRADEFIQSDISNKFFGDIKSTDHVVINGEGSIHGNSRKARMLLFLAYVSKDRYNINTHIINHTVQVDDPNLQKIVKMVFPKLDTLVFREPLSMDHYLSKVGEGNVVQGADAAWCFDEILSAVELNNIYESGGVSIWYPKKEPEHRLDFTRPYITIGGGSGFGHDTSAIAADFIDIVQSIENETSNVEIILTAAAHPDEQFMLKVSEKTGHPLVKLNNTSKIAASIIGNSEVYLGGRWHPSIFALVGGARLVNFNGNTFKIQAIKEQFDLEHPIYRCEEIGSHIDEITSSVSQKFDSKGERYTLTGEEIKEMRSLVKKNVDAIFE